ncbi:hypothetical protein BDW71DRAFT_188127 [Aspergillus fruticulosus]
MIEVEGYREELALICVVDFYTGDVLINSYVQSAKRVTDWISNTIGVTAAAMDAAVKVGLALRGWQSAQQALWHYADAETVIIRHSAYHDLRVFRVVYLKIVAP